MHHLREVQPDGTTVLGNVEPRREQRRGLRFILAGLLILAILVSVPILELLTRCALNMSESGVPRIPLSTAFAAFELYSGAQSIHDTFFAITAVNAVYNGFFGTPAPFKTSCPSGHCSWDTPYTTLAVCSSCTNITSSLTPYTDRDGQQVGIQLPNGFLLQYNAIHELPMGERQFYSNMNSTVTHADITPMIHRQEYSSIAYKDLPGKLHSLFTIIGSTPEIAVHMSEAPVPAAYECVLQWCLRQYTATVRNGQLTETVVNVINDTTVTITNPSSVISRQLTDPSTEQVYNVSSLSEFALSNVMARMVNGSRNANVSGDAEPLTALWNAVARPANSPTELYAHLASSISTFMRTNNSAILLANFSSAEGVATDHGMDAFVGVSRTWTVFLVLLAGALAFMMARQLKFEQYGGPVDERSSPLLRKC